MSSVRDFNSPPTLTEGPGEEYVESQREEDRAEQHAERPIEPEPELQPELKHQQQPKPRREPEHVPYSSHYQLPDRPPEKPPKDRDSEGRLSVLSPPRFSHVVDWSTTAQPSFTAAAQLMSHNMTGARSLFNKPIAAGSDSTDYNANTNATGLASDVSNRNAGTGAGPKILATNANLEVIRPVSPNPNRTHSPPSRPLSSLERRPTGPGLVPYDPIRGDHTLQPSYLIESNGYDGGGDPAGISDRNAGRRDNLPRPRSMVSPMDGTMVENGPGTWSGSRRASRLMSGQDWLVGVPVVERPPRQKTIEERLKPTIDAATSEREKFQKRSSRQSLLINGAIGLQIIAGALTTGVAAAGGQHIGTAVAGLGGLSTILASYLAKVRGSGEPEFSTIRTRELSSFLREAETFVMDHGDKTGAEYDEQIMTFRERFEMIIKTDGEDSGGGTIHSHHAPPAQPSPLGVPQPSVQLANGHSGATPMPGAYNPHEKRYTWKDEKTIGAVA